MKRRQPLARHQPLPTRQAPLRRQSLAQARQGAVQRRAYGAAGDAEQGWCTACGTWGPTDHSHLLAQGQHKQHRNDPRNWIRLCRECHEIYEHNKGAFAGLYPLVWAYILRRIKDIAPEAYEFFCLKNPF